jgi:NAD+ kinase
MPTLPTIRLFTAFDRELAAATQTQVEQVLDGHATITNNDCDLVISIGGDGTVIAAARDFVDQSIPILGVNCGRLGFLAPFTAESLADHAATVLVQHPPCRSQTVLSVTIEGSDGTTHVDKAVNDAVIHAGKPWRMLELALTMEGVAGPMLRGDGLVVASATGSTGHNLSAGGPILAPGTLGLVVTPIAPQSLAFRPIVAPIDAGLLIDVCQCNDGTELVIDGQVHRKLHEGDRISIARHGHDALFVERPDEPWWQILQDRMRWAIPPRLRDEDSDGV